ncbi:MAG: dihydroorotate dehydrogenase electron transfer subunit [Clostridia bacterium]|nr:dihydroorotate dehydrogenase electron transfer subunit [Clostridia bacterium]
MKDVNLKVISNNKIAKNTYECVLEGDISDITAPGQFVNIKLDGLYLRRPISVCDAEGNSLTLIYKVVGKGTEQMSATSAGESWLTLTGLGNGYDTSLSGECPLLIGGGAGVPPMYMLCKRLIGEGKRPTVILGFNTKDEVFYEKEFCALGAKVIVCTADGSYGVKGFVTTPMESLDYTYFYTCGPEPMLKAVYKTSVTGGQFSFEERMGCGFGACMGCSCKTVTGYKRICKDGPVLKKEEILWEM